MNTNFLKKYIYENNKIEDILIELEMHHIKWHDNNSYITCGMPDGDNPQSTVIYNNEVLNVVAYTRDIIDINFISDIFSLIMFLRKCDLIEAMEWTSNLLNLENEEIENDDRPESVKDILYKIMEMYINSKEPETPLKSLDEITLIQYQMCSFQQFVDDTISDETQLEFELGLDSTVDYWGMPRPRIAIPIRDENGTLVGVKGRLLKNVWKGSKCIDKIREEENEPKYIYMYPCAKSQILYGLYKTSSFIEQKKEVIICEAEKGVMQLWTYGYKNCVSVGGHSLSPLQVKKITKLDVNIVIAFDKDVEIELIKKECSKFRHSINNVYFIFDTGNILNEKESPMDSPEKWEKLYRNKKQYQFSEKF